MPFSSISTTPQLKKYLRKKTRRVIISYNERKIIVGDGSPIVIQSMTNTDTADAISTAIQIKQLVLAGSEIVRITVNTAEAAIAVPKIRQQLDRMGIDVPLIGDFHYNGHKLLSNYSDCAKILSKYRINPGNVGKGTKRDSQFAQMIAIACKYEKPVRIGVNWGSLDRILLARIMDENTHREKPWSTQKIMYETLITSAIENAEHAKVLGLDSNKIILSCKVSSVQDLICIYEELSNRCDYPLHLGLTEAGMGSKGIVASTAALAILLQQGIGDTIRISLTPEPDGDRVREVTVCQEILQTMGLRKFTPTIIACPGCGRTQSKVFQNLANNIQIYVREQMPIWKTLYSGVENMNIAVMGCIVNGPGESKYADIGISLPGTGEFLAASVFIDGEKKITLRGNCIAERFQSILLEYIKTRYSTHNTIL